MTLPGRVGYLTEDQFVKDITGSGGTGLSGSFQPLNAILTSVAGLDATAGVLVQTGASSFAKRTLTAPAAGITVTNPTGAAGNPTLVLANDLAALEALSGTNTIYYRSGVDTWSPITIGTGLTFSGGTLSNSATVTGAALTKTDDANVTLTLGGTPATALLQAVSLTLGWTGTLSTARGGVPQTAFTSYTPTWTNVTVGNGTVTAKYQQFGKLVLVRITFTLGTTSAISGDAKITLPVTAASASGNLLSLGRARFYDLSLDTAYDGDVHDTDTTHASFRINNVAGTYSTAAATSATAPLPWTTGDVLTAQFWYEAA